MNVRWTVSAEAAWRAVSIVQLPLQSDFPQGVRDLLCPALANAEDERSDTLSCRLTLGHRGNHLDDRSDLFWG